MNKRFQCLYIDIATRVAEMSSAVRLKVGCIIVKDDKIISLGYNGTPSGWDNNCEDIISEVWEEPDLHNLKTKPEVLHAESNALCKVAKSTESAAGAALFVTHAPCMECAKLIYQSGINSVYYRSGYRDTSGLEFLEKCKVNLEQI